MALVCKVSLKEQNHKMIGSWLKQLTLFKIEVFTIIVSRWVESTAIESSGWEESNTLMPAGSSGRGVTVAFYS